MRDVVIFVSLGSALCGMVIALWGGLRYARSGGDAGEIGSARVFITYGTVFFVLGIATAAVVAVADGVATLTAAEGVSVADSIGELLVVASASGVFAFALVQFVKLQSPLRTVFNRRQVDKLLSHRDKVEGKLSLQRPDHRVDSVVGRLPALSYDCTVPQLTAQLATYLRRLTTDLAEEDGVEPSSVPTVMRLLLATTREEFVRVEEFVRASGTSPGSEKRQAHSQARESVDLFVEERLDRFQIAALAQWHRLLRTAATAAAAGVSVMIAASTRPSLSTLAVAFVLGMFIGGPAAWVLRDITRVIERKARF